MKLVLFGLALFGATLATAAAADAPKAGQSEPSWHLTDLQGNAVTSDSLKGKVVILDFWATWCGPCKKEIPSYVELAKKYADKGLVIVGVSMDSSDSPVRKYVRDNGVNYAVGMSNDEIYAAFGQPDSIPTTFLIDRDGVIRDAKIGNAPPALYEKKVTALLN